MLRLLIIVLAIMALAACGGQPAAPAPRTEPAQIDSVEVVVRESFPVQVAAHITGSLGNGCLSLGEITQRRDGNMIEVSVPANHSGAEACTMQLQLIDEMVELQGRFEPGDYTVSVNGVNATFSV